MSKPKTIYKHVRIDHRDKEILDELKKRTGLSLTKLLSIAIELEAKFHLIHAQDRK